jgi:hypothetical protein
MGANFQLCSLLSVQNIQKGWRQMAQEIRKKAKQRIEQGLDSSGSLNYLNNLLDTVQQI